MFAGDLQVAEPEIEDENPLEEKNEVQEVSLEQTGPSVASKIRMNSVLNQKSFEEKSEIVPRQSNNGICSHCSGDWHPVIQCPRLL